jgi:F0F1-type ATP synthase delta subunit
MSELASSLCLSTYTLSDLDRRIGLLRASLEATLYIHAHDENDMKTRVLAEASKSGSKEDVAVLSLWYDTVWSHVTNATLRAYLSELEEASHTIARFTIYVPVVLMDPELAEIVNWYRKAVTPVSVFVVHVDPHVVGGCGFVSHDSYYENSLNTKLRERKSFITKLISQYA